MRGDNIVTKQEEQIIEQFQLYQQQAQNITTQKNTFTMELREINNAIDEMEKSKEEYVYRISGPILVKAKKSEVKKELEEKKEIIELRIKTLERQEEKVKEKLDELKEKIQSIKL